jgi:hypothetical protein
MESTNFQFFGVSEIQKTEEGLTLLRYPEAVVSSLGVPVLDERGNWTQTYTGHKNSARVCIGIEVRFIYDGDTVCVTLKGTKPISVMVFAGDYQLGYYPLEPGRNSFKVVRHKNSYGVAQKSCNRYPMNLWRIVPESDEPITLCDVQMEGACYYPKDKQVPCMLVYGSSISQGCGTPFVTMNYIDIAANLLGIEIKNKALAGGCFSEKAVLDFLLKEEFDCAYFELGTNIANRPLNIIEDRVGHFIDTVSQAFPEKTLYFMTPITGLSDVSTNSEDYTEYFNNAKSVILAHARKYKNAVILDGHELLDKHYYLSADILHPSAFGHVMMGFNLARMIGR